MKGQDICRTEIYNRASNTHTEGGTNGTHSGISVFGGGQIMKSFIAFMKKEWLEAARSGKLIILAILFLLFGIMNPAIAKLTPWIYELMAASIA